MGVGVTKIPLLEEGMLLSKVYLNPGCPNSLEHA